MDIKIPLKVLKKLPPGHTIKDVSTAYDMDGRLRQTLIVLWNDEYGYGRRAAHFDQETGENITESH